MEQCKEYVNESPKAKKKKNLNNQEMSMKIRKGMNRHFTQEYVQMVNKYFLRYSIYQFLEKYRFK